MPNKKNRVWFLKEGKSCMDCVPVIEEKRKEGMLKAWQNTERKVLLEKRPRVGGRFVKQSK